MCIRDSYKGTPYWKQREKWFNENFYATLAAKKVWPESKGCLLYTSDAADERSSVDLGGRRIIKKKKNSTKTVI